MKVMRHTVGMGDDRVHDTVAHMIRLAHEDVTLPAVQSIAKRLSSTTKSDVEKIQAVHDFIVDEIEYRLDSWKGEDIEVIAAPRHTIAGSRKYGDCDCMITAFACLLLALGIDSKIKVVAWRPDARDEYTHVYILAYAGDMDVWIPCDPTRGYEGFGWQVTPRYREHLYNV